jgi:SNF2 family DNA or RNA helicase
VDHYAIWAGLTPKEFHAELDLKEPRFKTLKVQGDYLVGSEEEAVKAWRLYRSDLLRREPGRGLRIKSGRAFSLVLKLVKDGVIPYSPKPVEPKRTWKCDVELRPYQLEALRFFLNYGNMVLLWPAGAGKTTFSIKAIAEVSGKTLIICPGLSLVAQWEKELRKHVEGPRIAVYAGKRREKGDVTITTYMGAQRFKTRGSR